MGITGGLGFRFGTERQSLRCAMLVLTLACAGLAVFAASASAFKPKQGIYEGKTSQGLEAGIAVTDETRYPCPTPDDFAKLCGEKSKLPWVAAASFYANCPVPDYEVGFDYFVDRKDGAIEPPASISRRHRPTFFVYFEAERVDVQLSANDPDGIASATISGYLSGRWKNRRTVKSSLNVELDFNRPDLPDCNARSKATLRPR